jgi:hypothetical protein
MKIKPNIIRADKTNVMIVARERHKLPPYCTLIFNVTKFQIGQLFIKVGQNKPNVINAD